MNAAVDAPDKPRLIATLVELTKLRISAASTVTAAAGYIACLRRVDAGLLTTLVGILLMAMGASAINECQERQFDARMARTHARPLPRSIISLRAALAIAGGLAVSGFLVLLLAHGLVPALLGGLAMAWYNAIYTLLKRVSAFAVVPGALIGALPPAIGWTAAGGHVRDPAILALAFVFFIWQVPHFWMLVAMHAEGYEAAGFPTIVKLLGRQRLARLSFTWICGTAAACGLLPMFRAIVTLPALLLLAAAVCWLVYSGAPLLRPDPDAAVFRRAFVRLNAFALVLTMALILDPFVAGLSHPERHLDSHRLSVERGAGHGDACRLGVAHAEGHGVAVGEAAVGEAALVAGRQRSEPGHEMTGRPGGLDLRHNIVQGSP